MLYMKIVKNKSQEFSPQIIFSISLVLYLYELMNVHWTYYDNHFMMYVSQIIMLCTLNLSIISQ